MVADPTKVAKAQAEYDRQQAEGLSKHIEVRLAEVARNLRNSLPEGFDLHDDQGLHGFAGAPALRTLLLKLSRKGEAANAAIAISVTSEEQVRVRSISADNEVRSLYEKPFENFDNGDAMALLNQMISRLESID